MSLNLIHLRKVLKFCMLDDDRAFLALRKEANEDRRRLEQPGEGGGDFFGPFWSDAKSHATTGTDLQSDTLARIERAEKRQRLYNILDEQFRAWWRQYAGAMNELLVPVSESVCARHDFDDFDVTIKVDNLLAFQLDRERHRLIYPYFSEAPALSERWARVALWVMHEVLSDYRLEDMVILDVQRGRSFSIREVDMQGDEAEVFGRRMATLPRLWDGILNQAN